MSLPVIAMVVAAQVVNAYEFQVTATVPAPIPTEAPIITSLASKTTTASVITVSGTCPTTTPAVIIALYDNSEFVGSDQCYQQKFSVPVSLSMGAHAIRATVMTITGQAGLSSDVLEITRVAETVQTQSRPDVVTQKTTSLPEPEVPLRIVSNKSFITFALNNEAVWHGRFVGGDAPYKVEVLWGDGDENKLNGVGQEEQTLSHRYDSIELAAYRIKVQLTDAKGRLSVHQIMAVTLAGATKSTLPAGVIKGTTPSEGIIIMPLPLMATYFIVMASLMFLWYREHGRNRRQFAAVRAIKQTVRSSRQK